MVVLVTLLAVAVGLLSLLVAGLLRSHAEILRSLHELGVDLDPGASTSAAAGMVPAPRRVSGGTVADVSGQDPAGAPQHLAVTGVAHSTLLAFLSSTCLTCRDFWDAFGDPSLVVPNDARVIVVTRGVEAESPGAVRKLASPLVHTVMSTEAWQRLQRAGRAVLHPRRRPSWHGGRRRHRHHVGAGAEPDRAGGRRQQRAPNRRRATCAAGIEPGDPSLYPEQQQ